MPNHGHRAAGERTLREPSLGPSSGERRPLAKRAGRPAGCRRGASRATLRINGKSQEVDVPPDMPLLWVLRDVLGMTGTKFGCGIGLCGACTVHVDGVARRSCSTPVSEAVGKAITTIEAIGATPIGRQVQAAWLDLEVVQCGYCQSGQIMAAAALLVKKPAPTDADIDDAMAGNVCRCGTYLRIRDAIKRAARAPATTVRRG
jgi:isoquinoline 1-oxidoreductase subunit alpha